MPLVKPIRKTAPVAVGAWATLRAALIAAAPVVLWTFEGSGAPQDQIGTNHATGPISSTGSFVFMKSGWGGGLCMEQNTGFDGWNTPGATRIGSGSWSLFALLKPLNATSGDFYDQRGPGGGYADSIQFIHDTNSLLMVYQYPSAAAEVFRSGAIPSGAWTAIGVTFDSSDGKLRFFLRGSSVQVENTTSWSPSTSNPSAIGNDPRTFGDGYNGDTQALGIWNSRLSDSAMQALVDQVS